MLLWYEQNNTMFSSRFVLFNKFLISKIIFPLYYTFIHLTYKDMITI